MVFIYLDWIQSLLISLFSLFEQERFHHRVPLTFTLEFNLPSSIRASFLILQRLMGDDFTSSNSCTLTLFFLEKKSILSTLCFSFRKSPTPENKKLDSMSSWVGFHLGWELIIESILFRKKFESIGRNHAKHPIYVRPLIKKLKKNTKEKEIWFSKQGFCLWLGGIEFWGLFFKGRGSNSHFKKFAFKRIPREVNLAWWIQL